MGDGGARGRPGRRALTRAAAATEVAAIKSYSLLWYHGSLPPSFGRYRNEHTKRWAKTIASFDGFVMVSPEYNHSTSGALKNAIDYLFGEWNNKAVGFVSYGAVGGARAVEHLRLVAGELPLADVRRAGHPFVPQRV